ncbi:MAG TPA: right-handed parallel beta-helix repeat-containing protein [Gemmatimonadota bacterium]|nr:right-handed parallel beta-helix repeat-containing protein [Gemmatimonadota bacterium]
MTLGLIVSPAPPVAGCSNPPLERRKRLGALGWTLIMVGIPMIGLPTCKAEPSADAFSAGGPALPDSPMSPPPAPPVGPSTPPPAGEQVPILPGEDIQAVVDDHPEGTLFLIRAGRHVGQSIRPKDGMSFVGEPGAILDGAGEKRYAFDGGDGPDDVSIRGLVIERYAPPPQDGAVMAKDTERWVVENNEIRYNTADVLHKGCRLGGGCGGMGIKIGDGMVVRGNSLHHNDEYGVGGNGDGVLIEGNEIAFNNYRGAVRVGFGAGGTKFVRTHELVVRNNYVHDNQGNGIWMDIENVDALVEDNRVENNSGNGIMYEISYGAVIRNNYVAGNGFANPRWLYGAGIFVSSSSDVEIYGNRVENNARGITAVIQNRGIGSLGRYEVRNLFVHDNDIAMDTGWTGLGEGVGDDSYYTDKNNRFERNRYRIDSRSRAFMWQKQELTLEEWQAYGHDDGQPGN